MSDLVSRKGVLKILTDISYNHCPTAQASEAVDLAKTMVTVMPSAQPEPKTGHWEFDWRHDKATCSECRHTFRCVFDIDNFDNFCRHCGAKMEDSR